MEKASGQSKQKYENGKENLDKLKDLLFVNIYNELKLTNEVLLLSENRMYKI